MIRIRRAYDAPSAGEGSLYLVDRFWPRGKTRDALHIVEWVRDAAPSKELCRWFGHDPERWEEFRKRYRDELDRNPEAWRPLLEAARQGTITLLFGARDLEHNNAVSLKEYLESNLK